MPFPLPAPALRAPHPGVVYHHPFDAFYTFLFDIAGSFVLRITQKVDPAAWGEILGLAPGGVRRAGSKPRLHRPAGLPEASGIQTHTSTALLA